MEKATTTNGPVEEVAASYTNQAQRAVLLDGGVLTVREQRKDVQAAATTMVTSGYVKKREVREPPPCLVFSGGAFAMSTAMKGLVEEVAAHDGWRGPWLVAASVKVQQKFTRAGEKGASSDA